MTGFHKRKLQRKKQAKEQLERDLKEERKRLKSEAKESYKKLVVSHRPIPELETLLKEEYEEDDVTVRVEELSTLDIAQKSHWIGENKVKYESSSEEEEVEEENEEIPGMALKPTKKKVATVKEAQKFDSERDVKKLLKKEATSKVKKSKVFQMKNKIEKQKQKKKSLQMKKERMRFRSGRNKSKHKKV